MPAAAAMKRAEARCPHRVRGLTLVELLVVFVLLALVSTLLFQGLGFFAAKYDTVQRWRAQGTDATLQQNWFVSTIRGLAPYGREVRRFSGNAASFAGITLQPLAGEPGMPLTARWSIEAGEGAEAIVYEEASMSGVDSVRWTILTPGETGLQFRYADSQGRWRDRWPIDAESIDWLPSSIRLITGTGRTFWQARVGASASPLVTDQELL